MRGMWLALAAVGLAACGGSPDSTFADEKPPAPAFGGTEGDLGQPADAPDGCAVAARLVYVVSQEKDLYSFAPNLKAFTKIGRLECPAAGVPASMAVDRSGTAWVNYANGALFKVSTADARCSETGFAPNQQGFLKFGMAFATNEKTGAAETLYISGLLGTSGKGFGKIDLGTMKVAMVGEYSTPLSGQAAELTGTGDGRLFGFFTTSPSATLAEIDRPSGATSADKPLQGVDTGNAFAFSFWGGDFWFYTSDGPTPSRVTQLETSTGKLVEAMPDVGGFRIVGAGVSTCAPLTPPR